jgi:mRNA interferase MazF
MRGSAMTIERFSIYWVTLDPVIGSEISKTRPVVIVSDDLMNRLLQTVVGCPLTSQLHPDWRTRIQIQCAGRPAEIAVDQIRALSKRRILSPIGALAPGECEALRAKIREMYG